MKIIITEEQYIRLIENQHDINQDALDKTGFWGNAGAGCIIMSTNTGRILLPLRSKHVREPHTWGTWGGAIDEGESPRDAAMREVSEEAGYVGAKQIIPLHVFHHQSGFKYYNFLILVTKEFKPNLDHETDKAYWFYLDELPKPLHFGLKGILTNGSDMEILNRFSNQIRENIKPKQIIVTENQLNNLLKTIL